MNVAKQSTKNVDLSSKYNYTITSVLVHNYTLHTINILQSYIVTLLCKITITHSYTQTYITS